MQVVQQIVAAGDGGEEVIDLRGAPFAGRVKDVAHAGNLAGGRRRIKAHKIALRRKAFVIALEIDSLEEVDGLNCHLSTFMSTAPGATNPKKILVVDDNEIILKTTSMKLQSAGYQVFTALDGAEGVAAVRKEKPDLVLLDIAFPPDVSGVSWDGFRIMEWLHRVDETKRIPIIIISGAVEEKNKQRAVASGAVAFFPKPVNFNEMLKVIRATLETEANKAPTAV